MRGRWGRALQILVAVAVILYAGDWVTLRVRTGPDGASSAQVEQFLRTPLKGQKEEFDYMGTVATPCVPSLFPHRSMDPCWWLHWHKIQWVSP
jgi:hypothetical protein